MVEGREAWRGGHPDESKRRANGIPLRRGDRIGRAGRHRVYDRTHRQVDMPCHMHLYSQRAQILSQQASVASVYAQHLHSQPDTVRHPLPWCSWNSTGCPSVTFTARVVLTLTLTLPFCHSHILYVRTRIAMKCTARVVNPWTLALALPTRHITLS